MQTKTVNIQLSINLTALIKLVIIKTLISLVNFYMVKIDTPFLLYFVNIDRLQIYYNNIINTLISLATALKNKNITLLII